MALLESQSKNTTQVGYRVVCRMLESYLSLPEANRFIDAVLTQGVTLSLHEGAAHVQTLGNQTSLVDETLPTKVIS